MAGKPPEWLATTVGAVRELMMRRLEAASLDDQSRRETERALEELDVMWEELQGQAAQLARENERYAQFFEFAPDAYLISDAGGNIREANQAALELFRAARGDLVGRSLDGLIADDERAAFLTRSRGVMIGSAAVAPPWQANVRTLEGSTLRVEFSVRAIPLKESGIGGVCWLLRPAR